MCTFRPFRIHAAFGDSPSPSAVILHLHVTVRIASISRAASSVWSGPLALHAGCGPVGASADLYLFVNISIQQLSIPRSPRIHGVVHSNALIFRPTHHPPEISSIHEFVTSKQVFLCAGPLVAAHLIWLPVSPPHICSTHFFLSDRTLPIADTRLCLSLQTGRIVGQ
jgi:hypothetical protein